MSKISVGGIHHVTAMVKDAQRNVDFYTDVLGLRFVKKTVNQDDPFTYHLYYGDMLGRPGTAMTFFPFPGVPVGQPGHGQVYETAFSVPAAALGAWRERLDARGVTVLDQDVRFGTPVLQFVDPDGLIIALVGDSDPGSEAGWPAGPISADEAVRSFSHVLLASTDPDATARVLTQLLGYAEAGAEDGVTRYAIGEAERAGHVDLLDMPPAGRPGAGTVHHVAFRVPDRDTLLTMQQQLVEGGMRPTQEIDRFYFRSVYFREPGGILFEIASDDPGFTVDEDEAQLGSELKLTAAHEPLRDQIEAKLPPIQVPESKGATS